MLKAKDVINDLNDICAETNAHWLCYDDIHTLDAQKDADIFIREMGRLGYSLDVLLIKHYVEPAYAGGFEIKHQEEAKLSGYTMNGKYGNKNKLVVVAGLDEDNDKYVVYHEAAHLYQFKYNIFDMRYRDEYRKYLSETHANTFSAMVLLLKSDSVLEYKKRRLARIADGISKLNDKRAELVYYISLPIELALIKEIRRKGRKNVVREFSKKDGRLDFKKMIFFTKSLVEKYGYSKDEFEKIKKGDTYVPRYFLLKSKAKSYRILGKAYWSYEMLKYRKKARYNADIEKKRLICIKEKLKPLEEVDKNTRILNSVCVLDSFSVSMICNYNIWTSLKKLKEDSALDIADDLDKKKKQEVKEIFEKMKDIYQKWQNEPYFQELFSKIVTLDGRDEVWALKEQKQKELQSRNFEFGFHNER